MVADGRYDYIETGSLISIKKNVQDILIPSEEMKIPVYPMDYEEFCWAIGENYDLLREVVTVNKPLKTTNDVLMRRFLLYMAVGGMPQAVAAYVMGKNFQEIDAIKKESSNCTKKISAKLIQAGVLWRFMKASPANFPLIVINSLWAKLQRKRKQAITTSFGD